MTDKEDKDRTQFAGLDTKGCVVRVRIEFRKVYAFGVFKYVRGWAEVIVIKGGQQGQSIGGRTGGEC